MRQNLRKKFLLPLVAWVLALVIFYSYNHSGTSRQVYHPPLALSEVSRVAIIGAGPTGLGAAHRLYELGILRTNNAQVVILEQQDIPGGLATSQTSGMVSL